MTYKTFLGSTIEKYASIRVIEKERTSDHCGVNNRFLMAYGQNSCCSTDKPCLRAVSLEVAYLATSVASLAHSSTGGLVDWLRRSFTKTGSVPPPITVQTLHLPAGADVMEVALVALRQTSSVLLYRSSSGRCYRSMYCHDLLLFGSLLLLLLVIPEILLGFSGFGGF